LIVKIRVVFGLYVLSKVVMLGAALWATLSL
jgi:hypothetical protein